MLTLTTKISNCNDCRHKSHSGTFTDGGAQPVCAHPNACDEFKDRKEPHHWKHRVLPYKLKSKMIGCMGGKGIYKPQPEYTDGIPNWCPLKHGSQY